MKIQYASKPGRPSEVGGGKARSEPKPRAVCAHGRQGGRVPGCPNCTVAPRVFPDVVWGWTVTCNKCGLLTRQHADEPSARACWCEILTAYKKVWPKRN